MLCDLGLGDRMTLQADGLSKEEMSEHCLDPMGMI